MEDEEKVMTAEMREGYLEAANDWFEYHDEDGAGILNLIYDLGNIFTLTKAEIIEILERNGIELTPEWVGEYGGGIYEDDLFTLRQLRNAVNDAASDGGDPDDYEDEDEDEDEDDDEDDEDDEDEDEEDEDDEDDDEEDEE